VVFKSFEMCMSYVWDLRRLSLSRLYKQDMQHLLRLNVKQRSDITRTYESSQCICCHMHYKFQVEQQTIVSFIYILSHIGVSLCPQQMWRSYRPWWPLCVISWSLASSSHLIVSRFPSTTTAKPSRPQYRRIKGNMYCSCSHKQKQKRSILHRGNFILLPFVIYLIVSVALYQMSTHAHTPKRSNYAIIYKMFSGHFRSCRTYSIQQQKGTSFNSHIYSIKHDIRAGSIHSTSFSTAHTAQSYL
jgi:hypothetical protein